METGSRTRRFTRRRPRFTASSGGRFPRASARRYGRPSYRGIYARVNKGSLPELKSHDTRAVYIPVRMGNNDGSYSTDNSQTSIFQIYNGDNEGGWLWLLNGVGAGSGLNQRIGRVIQNKSLLLNMVWRMGSSIAENTQPINIRTMIIWDKQPNGIRPAIADFLLPVPYLATDISQPHSPNELNNRDRFRTLMDIRDTLTPGGDSSRQYDRFLKISGETVFNGAAFGGDQDVGDMQTGAIWMILLSDCSNAVPQTGNVPFATFCVRHRFTDP